MSDTPIRFETVDDIVGKEQPVHSVERVALDSRFPRSLDHHGYALQVLVGRVDVFAVWVNKDGEGARHHLFRIEKNEIILELVDSGHAARDGVRVIAIGSAGAEALLLP